MLLGIYCWLRYIAGALLLGVLAGSLKSSLPIGKARGMEDSQEKDYRFLGNNTFPNLYDALVYERKFKWIFGETNFLNMLFFLLRPLRNSSGILLSSRARLDHLVALSLRWYKVSFDKCSLSFSINFMMEGSLNVDSFDKSLLFSISFTMEGSLLSDHS